jgi:hypothetical protein
VVFLRLVPRQRTRMCITFLRRNTNQKAKISDLYSSSLPKPKSQMVTIPGSSNYGCFSPQSAVSQATLLRSTVANA